MKSLKFLSLLFIVVASMVACSKDDTTKPVINITSPTNGQIITAPDTLLVTGTVTDDEELSTIVVAGNDITPLNSKTSHKLDLSLTIPATQPKGNINIEISATDKTGNKETKTISLIVK